MAIKKNNVHDEMNEQNVEEINLEFSKARSGSGTNVLYDEWEPKATGKSVKIRIPRTKADQEDVFCSVNNYTCIIKRGVEVEVPDYIAEVLRHQEEMLEEIMLFEDSVQNKHK